MCVFLFVYRGGMREEDGIRINAVGGGVGLCVSHVLSWFRIRSLAMLVPVIVEKLIPEQICCAVNTRESC